jgi:hypothetical protein
VKWHRSDEPSRTLFRLDDGPELEGWDLLRAQGDLAERQLREAQGTLCMAAASIASALTALTREVILTSRVRTCFALSVPLLRLFVTC